MIVLMFISVMSEHPNDRTFILELYQEFYRLMFSTAGKYSLDYDSCEEVVQESLLKLINKVSLLKELPRTVLASYIVSTTKNTAINYIKNKNRQRAQTSSFEDEIVSSLEAPIPSLDELMQLIESQDRLEAVLEQISEEDRILLEGKYILDYSDEVLAGMLNCKPNSIRMKLTRARRRALKLLVKEGDEIK